MRVRSDWRLQGLLGLVVVSGGLGWWAGHSSGKADLPQWAQRVVAAVSTDTMTSSATASLLDGFGKTPLHFEPNVGQTHSDVKFMAQGGGYALFLTANEAVLRLNRNGEKNGTVLRARLEGANPRPVVHGSERQGSYSNYLIGNDPRQWHSGVAHYSRVHYSSVWPGIDLVYYGNQRQLEYDFIVQPGANPGLIRMSWHGADNLFIDNDGNLIAETALGPVRQHKPVVYQTINGQRKNVDGRYALAGRNVSFALGDYDSRQPLVIDPILSYSTYLGGGSLENFNLTGIAASAKGAAYITGYADDISYPVTTGAYQPSRLAAHNTVISKLNYNGTSLVYSTYLGGNKPGRASSIAVDASGNAYVAGSTLATDFPMAAAPAVPYQASNNNSKGSGFLSKLAADGKSLVYSTYLGGSGGITGDHITALAVDASGQAYVTGDTDSSDFPRTTGAGKPAGSISGFVSRISANGSSLGFSTFFGGNGNDLPHALALGNGTVFIAGTTASSNLPGALNSLSGSSDAFVARLSNNGSMVDYTRYVGGSNDEEGLGLATDAAGNVWVAGSSKSSNFPVLAAPNGLPSEGSKAEGVETGFLTRLDSSGAPTYSTFLGTSGKATAVAVTSTGQAVVVGQMTAAFTPASALSEVTTTDTSNGFIRRLASDGSLLFSTPLGGSHSDEIITALALDAVDSIYVTGNTRSNNFPLVNPPAYSYSSSVTSSGFAGKVNFGPKITLVQGTNPTGMNKDITLGWQNTGASNCQWSDDPGTNVPDPANGTRTLRIDAVGSYEYTMVCTNSSGSSSSTVTIDIVAPPGATLTITPNPVAVGQEATATWTTTNAKSCYIKYTVADPDGGSDIVRSSAVDAAGGSTTYTPTTVGVENYELNCSGPGSDTAVSSTVVLNVVGKPTLTLDATPSANPLLLGVSGSNTVTYTWSGESLSSCTASGDITALNGTQPGSGSQTVTMTSAGDKTLKMDCTGLSGLAVPTKSVKVTVLDPAQPPSIDSFSASPASLMLYRNTVLSWEVSNAQSCSASADAGAGTSVGTGSWAGNKALSGSSTVTPQTMGEHTYRLTCQGPGGSSHQDIEVDVTEPPDPVITSLSVSPSTIALGDRTTVNWQATDADGCIASGDWSGSKNASGSASIKPTRQGSHTLTLSCSGAGSSEPATRSVTLTVTAAASSGDNSSDEGGGDSGGPVDLLLLGGLALLGLHRRQALR